MSDSYRDRLVVALRQRDIPGQRIGEIVAEVEAYTADSGQDPNEAFGPPDTYAEEIAAAWRRQPLPWWRVRVLAGAYPPAVGALVLGDGVWGLVSGEPTELTLGEAAVAALLPLAALLLFSIVLWRRRWYYALGAAIPIAGAALAWLGHRQILVRYPAWAALVVGAVLLFGGLLVITIVSRDPVRDPANVPNLPDAAARSVRSSLAGARCDAPSLSRREQTLDFPYGGAAGAVGADGAG